MESTDAASSTALRTVAASSPPPITSETRGFPIRAFFRACFSNMFPCCSGGRHHSSLEDDNRSFNDGVEHFKQLWNKRLKEVNDFFQLQKNDPKKHPTFHLILQLYAHENHIIEQLYSQKDALEVCDLISIFVYIDSSKTHHDQTCSVLA